MQAKLRINTTEITAVSERWVFRTKVNRFSMDYVHVPFVK